MDKNKVKEILQKEINLHSDGIKEHSEKFGQTKSKKQKEKKHKHFHKKFQTINIAKQLGFDACPHCGNLK